MDDYRPAASPWENLTATTTLTAHRAAVIKQTYVLFGLSVFSALAGGYVGATSETMVHLFSGWLVFVMGFGLLWLLGKLIFRWTRANS